jgi:hypothetical protein
MSEESTTPHESDSHASAHPEAVEVNATNADAEPIAPVVEVSETEPADAEAAASAAASAAVEVAESEPVKAAVPEAAPTQIREPIPVAVEESGTKQTLDKVLKIAKDTWTKVQPVLKEKGTQALLVANRFTNDFLDHTGPKLTKQAIAKIPDSTKVKVAEQKAKLQPTLDKLQPVWDKAVVPTWQKLVVPTWNKGIKLLKQRLPANLQELTERFLTVAVITTFVVIYWFFSSLTSGKPAVAKQPMVSSKPVLTRPAPQRATPRPVVQPSVAPAPAIKPPPAVAIKPVAPAVPPKVVTVPPPTPQPKASAPVASPKVVAPAPTPVPSPTIDLVDIQSKLSSEVANLGEELVASVKTANDNRQINISLGADWDSLSVADQEAAAEKLWGRSQKLDFKKMELFNSNNTLIARNPVVGSKVIMLQR